MDRNTYCQFQIDGREELTDWLNMPHYCYVNPRKYRGVAYAYQNKQNKMFLQSSFCLRREADGAMIMHGALTADLKNALILNLPFPEIVLVPDGFNLVHVCC